MNEPERRLAAFAAEQRQVFTRAQALAAGLSASGLSRRKASGQFVVVGPRTFTLGGVCLDWRGRLQAGLLDLGPGALVSAEAGVSRRRTLSADVWSSWDARVAPELQSSMK